MLAGYVIINVYDKMAAITLKSVSASTSCWLTICLLLGSFGLWLMIGSIAGEDVLPFEGGIAVLCLDFLSGSCGVEIVALAGLLGHLD